MWVSRRIIQSLLVVAQLSLVVQAILPIQIKSYRFIKGATSKNDPDENSAYFVKGVDYQPGGSSAYNADSDDDLFSDPSVCARDAFVFQQLGINTVRIYSLNPDVNHDECMTIFNDAGIYVILDVNSGNYGENLDRANPSGTYDGLYLTRVFKFIDAFKNYPNVLGFFSGNEVINDDSNYAQIDPPYVRAVQRDMKQYIAKHSNRSIPVGYSAADNVQLRLATFKYLQCNSLDGSTVSNDLDESRSDFFGLNSYQWCSGTSDWASSGYGDLNSSFSDAVIPLIFSEYGCNKNLPRTFDEVPDGLYGGLVDTFSGGLVFEYAEEANNYGLVDIDDSDGSIEYKQDYENLQSQFNNLTLPDIKESDIGNNTLYKCDASAITSVYSGFGTNNFTLPTQPADIANMIKYGVNGSNTGSILTDYTVPTTFNYTVKDVQGNTVSATLSLNQSNTINSFDSTSSSTSTSALSSSTGSSSTSTQKNISTSGSATSSKSSSKSKGAAAAEHLGNVQMIESGILALLTGLLSAIL